MFSGGIFGGSGLEPQLGDVSPNSSQARTNAGFAPNWTNSAGFGVEPLKRPFLKIKVSPTLHYLLSNLTIFHAVGYTIFRLCHSFQVSSVQPGTSQPAPQTPL